MVKDHYVVLDRAVEKIHIRLDELKVRRSGFPEWAAEGTILHQNIRPSPRSHICTPAEKAGEPAEILVAFSYA